ncbi:uncharacterized protein LOC119165240 isoform X2 [Rhipicephalus microplus]
MLSIKNRLSARTVSAVIMMTCLCLGLVMSTWYPSRTLRHKYSKNTKKTIECENLNKRISINEDSPLMVFGFMSYSPRSNVTEASIHGGDAVRQSYRNKKIFDPTMLTGADDIHVERLARLESTIKGMREFLVRHIPRSSCPGMNKRVLAVLVKAREYLRVMEADVAAIRETDRAVRKSAEKMRRLRDYVRHTIERLQNPADCKSAPKLRCLLDNPSGLAAGAHDVLWCFVAALQTGRTLILNSTPWHYTPNDSGWTEVLQPVAGPSCENAGSQNMIVDGYPGHEWGLKTRRRMRDLPASFAKDLVANHGEPYAWWYGQILAYIFRLQNSTREFIEDFKIKNDYKHPMVALHIRRTDKKKEAAFHDVAEYMQHAEEFYSSLALRGQPVQKRVFIATDDPEVITEIIQNNEEHTSTTFLKTTSSERFMLSNKNRLSVKAIGTVVLMTCLCIVLVISSGYPRRTFRHKDFKKNTQKNTMKRNNFAMRIRKDSSLMAFGLLSCSPESNLTKDPFDTKDPVPQSSRDEKTFDPTMLTGADDIHVERLARLESSIKGMREFLVRHLPRRSSNGKITRAAAFLAKAREYLRVLEADVAAIRKTDRAVRMSAEKSLRNYVRKTIEQLQNPADCKSAPKLRCVLNNTCGLAAGAHDVLWCFVAALRMGRTLILKSTRWHYAQGDGGWTEVLQPVTGPSCNGAGSENMIVDGYPGYNSVLKERSQILDLPASITKDLVANHGGPYAWWYGQIMAYVFRLQNSTRELIEDFKMNHDYKHPIVALHIRRTDKKREAAFHDVAEYMQHAEEFYSSLALRGQPVQKRVFVSTDDPKVITEIIRKFPAYKVISNHLAALEAFDLQTRVNNSTLANVLIDIYLLAESDYLVCAFSSGFCRVAYELMQARYAETGADATHKAVSVDIEYFYAFVPFPPRRTLYCNKRVFHNELEWTLPGVLIERPDEFMPVREAKEKRYADGFNTGRRVGSRVDYNRMMFPRFKTVRTYSVAQYGAFNDSRV